MSATQAGCLALAALMLAGAAMAQPYPAKPVRLVVPYPPGSSNDVLSRNTAQAMSPGLGQAVVVDNRGGAGGMIGAENVARALESADLRQRFAAEGAEPGAMTREQLARFVASEIARWRKVAPAAGIKPE